MEPFVLIIFGITGNLSQIKLIPALYDIAEKGLLPKGFSVVGIARSKKTDGEFKKYLTDVLKQENRHHKHAINEAVAENLFTKMHYLDGNLDDPALYSKVDSFLGQSKTSKNRIFYLATYPDLYRQIFEHLKKTGLSKQDTGWVRLIIEKPIGNDLSSAQALNGLLADYFTQDQVYRLDHYLGKETIQNILTFRFGNDVFEPMINSQHVDHIQITAAEDFGIGERGGYYDSVGALKDVGQNHLLQMLAFATMDAPSSFTNEEVTRQRIKILKNLVPMPGKLVLGQYEGYRQETNVISISQKDTFFAFKTEIRNERFKGVPIYIRGGKKLAQYVTEVALVFKAPTNRLFKGCNIEMDQECAPESNILIYRIQPSEGVVLKILTKKPGLARDLQATYMEFCYRPDTGSSHHLLDPYERLIFDAIKGDQTFFNDAEEIEAEWAFIDSLTTTYNSSSSSSLSSLGVEDLSGRFGLRAHGLEGLRAEGLQPTTYQPGTWGPKEADKLIQTDGREWLEPSMDFCKI